MHPSLRILYYLSTVVFLVAHPSGLRITIVFSGSFLFLIILQINPTALFRWIQQLRWFWISMVILFFWFTPGDQIWPSLTIFSPTYPGVISGCLHILTLLTLLVVASLLLRVSDPQDLCCGLYQLLKPLDRCYPIAEVFALRVALVFNALQELRNFKRKSPKNASARIGHRIDNVVTSAAQLLQYALIRATQAGIASRPIGVSRHAGVGWVEWFGWVIFNITLYTVTLFGI